MADLSTMSDADLEAIANSSGSSGATQPAGSIDSSNIPVPADLGTREASDHSGSLVVNMTPHPARVVDMSDKELEKIVNSQPQQKSGPLANSPDDTLLSGSAKNFGASAIRGGASPLGMFGDARETGKYVASRIVGKLLGRSPEDLRAAYDLDADISKQKVKMGRGNAGDYVNAGLSALPTTEDIAAPILARTGDYQPTTLWGRIGSAGTQMGTAMLAPAALSGSRGLDLARQIIAGAATGGFGQTATEATDDPLTGLAATLSASKLGSRLSSVTGKLAEPYRAVPAAQRQSVADARLLANTQDPKAAIAKLSNPNEIIPSSNPRTAEVTLDPGHAIADELTATRDSQYRMGIKARESEQNSARRNVVQTLSDPNADPAAIGQAFRDHLESVEAEHEAATQTAKQRAAAAAADIQPIEAEEVGARRRAEIGEAQQGRYNYFNEAYSALDPEGKLNAVTSPIASQTAAIRNAPNRDIQPLSPLAEEMVKRAEMLKPVEPLSRIRAFDQALTAAMKKAKLSGDEGYADIAQLKSAVKDAYANAAENQVKWENAAVERGDMLKEDTFAHKLAQSVKSYYANRASQTAGPNAAGNGTRGSGSVSSKNGTGAGLGVSGSGEGLPTPNLTPETSQRLAELNKEYGEFRSLYGSDPIKSLLKTEGFSGQYGPNDAKVISKIFPAGEGGYEAASRALRAAQYTPESIADMKAIAVSRLRKEMEGNTLAPEKLKAWQNKYRPALKAIDEVSPGFSDSFNSAAAATKVMNQAIIDQKAAIAEAQKGVAAKFLNLDHADDVIGEVGKAMSATNSGQLITQMMNRMKGNPAAVAGLKKAATDWLLGKASNAGVTMADEHVLSGDKVVKFVRDNPTAIKTLFGDDGLKLLQNVSKDMERTQQLRTLQQAQGSPTAQRTLGKMIDEAVTHETGEGNTVGNMAAMGALMELFEGNPVKAAGMFAAKGVMEKVGEVLEHRRGDSLAEVHRMFKEGLTNPDVAKAMLERAVLANGKPNTAGFNRLMRSLNLLDYEAGNEERKHRASGGRIGIDHKAMAEKLIKIAEGIKRDHGRKTSQLLKVPDEIISSALKIVNRR